MKKYIVAFLLFLPYLHICTEQNVAHPLQKKIKHRAEQIGHIIIIGTASTLGYIGYKTAHVFTGAVAKKIAPKIPFLALYPIVQHGYWLYKKTHSSPVNTHGTTNKPVR